MSLVLKITKKYHMVEKRVKKFGQGLPPPLFGQCRKENGVPLILPWHVCSSARAQ